MINDDIKTMKLYLLMKFKENDFHGVSDAAKDIRVLLAKLEIEENDIDKNEEIS